MVTIKLDRYEYCQMQIACSNMSSNTRNGIFIKNRIDPSSTMRLGLLAECAFSKLTGLPQDLSYHKQGDGGVDYRTETGCKIDIKTAGKDYGCGLIKHSYKSGKRYPMKSDLYIFSITTEIIGDSAEVRFIGYQTKENIEQYPAVAALHGTHTNYAIPYVELQPMDKFLHIFQEKDKRIFLPDGDECAP